jgi:hypothetical protein
VLRSIAGGTNRVHHSLNCLRAMMLCCAANSDIRTRLTATASPAGTTSPLSIAFGTTRSVTNPTA